MPSIKKTCAVSGKEFVISEEDQAFYARIGVPMPTLCPDERQKRRMSFRNERNLYHRKCDLCGKQIISIYHSASPYTVYCNSCWWSDKWDPKSYGVYFDFSRLFFEQFAELQSKVPRLALFQKNNENCDYTNHTENNKNCYICIDTAGCENVYYSKWMIGCEDCCDSYNIEKCQLCYESQYAVGLYSSKYIFYGDHNLNCSFLYNCNNCQNCFMCSDLNRQEYCIYNKKVGKEKYEEFMKNVDLGSHEQCKKYFAEYLGMIKNSKKRPLMTTSENCTGDCIYACKNVLESFDIIESQDCKFCYEGNDLKDCYDTYESAFECELQYECHGCNRSKYLKFGHVSYDMSDSEYVDSCHNSINLFGCVGMRRSKYCILNKEYSKEEYENLKSRIIEYMKKTGEWGEFFPIKFSPFAYNETIAEEYYLMTKNEALAQGYKWKDEDENSTYQGGIYNLPDNISDAKEDLTKAILKCEASGKFYKIIPQELEFYKKIGIAVPRRCPQQRYKDRLALRNPRKLCEKKCIICSKDILIATESENVYCTDCYLKTIYE